ncbi:hypothetical protein RJ639_022650, partial [Escallonia herrerae]
YPSSIASPFPNRQEHSLLTLGDVTGKQTDLVLPLLLSLDLPQFHKQVVVATCFQFLFFVILWAWKNYMADEAHSKTSQRNFQSISDVDEFGYLVDDKGLDSSNSDIFEVENPHFEDGVHDIGEAQRITFKDCDTHAETITVRNYDARDGGKGCSEFDSEQILGKVFLTEEEACFFYNQYALVKGFGTRVHFSNKRGATKQVYRKQLVCNKQGFKCLKDKRHIGRQPKRRRETRTGCEAMFQISLSKDGYWFVKKFNDVHNHEMIGTPSKDLQRLDVTPLRTLTASLLPLSLIP